MNLATFRDSEAPFVRAWLRRTAHPFAAWCGHQIFVPEASATYALVDGESLVAMTCPVCLAVEFFDIGLSVRV